MGICNQSPGAEGGDGPLGYRCFPANLRGASVRNCKPETASANQWNLFGFWGLGRGVGRAERGVVDII